MNKCTKPKLVKINLRVGKLPETKRIRLRWRVTGAKISKSDYTRKLEAKSDLFQRRMLYKNKCKLRRGD